MGNLFGNISLALKLKLGYIPSTLQYEAKLQKSWEDVIFFQQFLEGNLWKEYVELKGKKYSSKNEQRASQVRLKNIEKSDEWRRYKKLAKSSQVSRMIKMEETFADNFDGNSINQDRWLPKYFWGDKLIGKGYSHSEEFHHYTEGQNLHVKNGRLIIKTEEGSHAGMAWDKKFGFIPKKCDFTSGIINTGHSFRQRYGRFEAKVTFSRIDGVYNAFWMVGDNVTPHLNVFKINQNLELGVINGIKEVNQSKVSSDLLKENTYIVGLEWGEKDLKWLINGVVVKKMSNNLPDTPLYLVFSSGIQKKPSGKIANDFIIDWVRCYKRN